MPPPGPRADTRELSERARSSSLSITLTLDARAKALLAEGRDIVNMSVGEPDFDAPAAAQAAACSSVRGGAVRYTPAVVPPPQAWFGAAQRHVIGAQRRLLEPPGRSRRAPCGR